jgi:hypothetical protein
MGVGFGWTGDQKDADTAMFALLGLSKVKANEVVLTTTRPFDILTYIPLDFVLSTNNQQYSVHRFIIDALSPVVKSARTTSYHLDLDDSENLFDKFARLFRGERVTMLESERKFYRSVTGLLQINSVPSWMLPRSLRSDIDFEARSCDLEISNASFNRTISTRNAPTFTIVTPARAYSVNRIALVWSSVLNHLISSSPSLNEISLEIDDDEGRFDEVRRLFSFGRVRISHKNIDFLHEIATYLGISQLHVMTSRFLNGITAGQEKLESATGGIALIIDLQDVLLNLSMDNIDSALDFVAHEMPPHSVEDGKQLIAIIFPIARARPELSAVLALFTRRLFDNYNSSFCELTAFLESNVLHKPSCPGSFAYHLHVHGLLAISSVVRFYRHKLRRGKPLELPLPAWFLPELADAFPMLSASTKSIDPSLSDRRAEYAADDWALFRSLGALGANPDPFATAIRADDPRTLQTLIADFNTDYDRPIPPSLFEGHPSLPLIDYAAHFRAIQCVRFLHLNHARWTPNSLVHAIHGGDPEVIHLADEHIPKPNPKPTRSFQGLLPGLTQNLPDTDPVKASICSFQFSVSEWLFANDRALDNSLPQYCTLALRVGNVRFLSLLIDRGFAVHFSTFSDDFMNALNGAARAGFHAVVALLLSFPSSVPPILVRPKFLDQLKDKVKLPDKLKFCDPLVLSAMSGSLFIVQRVSALFHGQGVDRASFLLSHAKPSVLCRGGDLGAPAPLRRAPDGGPAAGLRVCVRGRRPRHRARAQTV